MMHLIYLRTFINATMYHSTTIKKKRIKFLHELKLIFLLLKLKAF
jgi:hypothetical protein